jgi:16S rRNA A1518/A1519 N6-dimethyltransferase RsmA/KsgA/DIM1 with predicted DNA glycosylase/AP lyase activity
VNRIRWAVDTLDPGPDDLLLEIGCGPGTLTGHLTEAGFEVEVRTAGSLVAVVATPKHGPTPD